MNLLFPHKREQCPSHTHSPAAQPLPQLATSLELCLNMLLSPNFINISILNVWRNQKRERRAICALAILSEHNTIPNHIEIFSACSIEMCVNVICTAFDIQQASECISLTSAQHAFMHTYDFQIAL